MSEEYIFGWHAVEAVLKREPERIQQVWIQTGREDRFNRMPAKNVLFRHGLFS